MGVSPPAACFELPSRLLDRLDEQSLLGKRRPVLCRKNLVRQSLECILGYGVVFLGAEDEPDRWVLAWECPVFPRIVEVEVHLAGVGVRELVELEVDDDQATQPTMEEEQVDPVPLVADPQPPLTTHEREVAAQLQQERFQLRDERGFQVGLGILILEREEFEEVGILDLLLRRERIVRRLRRSAAEHRRLVLGEDRALVELAADLAVELSDRPATSKRLRL